MSHRFFINNQVVPQITEEDQPENPPEDYLVGQIRDITQSILSNKPPTEEQGQIYEIYLGYAGIAYMFYHLSKTTNSSLLQESEDLLSNAKDYIKLALEISAAQQIAAFVPSFLLGNCGVYAIAAVIYHAHKDEENSQIYQDMYYDAAITCKEFRFLTCGSDELFVGRAGYLCGAIFMSKETGRPLRLDVINDVCNTIITSGRQYSDLNKLKEPPLMYAYYNVEYLGAGHGLSSVLLMILSVPGYVTTDAVIEANVKASVDYILTLQDGEYNFPCRVGERDVKNDLIHWCHGAGGIVYLMAKAYLLWKDEKYLNSCMGIGDLIWEKGLLRKGPGLCHGVAGNGYVFLLLYRLTDDNKYLDRALSFAKFLNDNAFKSESRIPDNPYSLFEGIAGTACFLSDILDYKTASFPFFDVFV